MIWPRRIGFAAFQATLFLVGFGISGYFVTGAHDLTMMLTAAISFGAGIIVGLANRKWLA